MELKKQDRTIITMGENKQKMSRKVDITDYQDLADCIRSDQVPAEEIAEIFTDKAYYKWYKKRYFKHK